MIVDPRNPEVSEQLAAWFRARDRLLENRTAKLDIDADLDDLDEKEFDLLEELVEIGDELVAFMAPDAQAREHHLSINADTTLVG